MTFEQQLAWENSEERAAPAGRESQPPDTSARSLAQKSSAIAHFDLFPCDGVVAPSLLRPFSALPATIAMLALSSTIRPSSTVLRLHINIVEK